MTFPFLFLLRGFFVFCVMAGALFFASPLLAQDTAQPMTAVPFRADAGLILAESQLADEKYTQALKTLAIVLKRKPGNADALTYSGYALLMLGDTEKAEAFFDQALKYDPQHLGANKYKGEMYLARNDFGRAQEQLQAIRLICGGTDCPEEHALAADINRFGKNRAGEQKK